MPHWVTGRPIKTTNVYTTKRRFSFANRSFQADSNQADASYAMAMASGKMTDVETENKKLVAYVRDIKNMLTKH
jgi:hypothetical protein